MAQATDHNPNQTKVPGVAGSRPAAGGNSAPEVSKFAPEWQQALAGNYKQACSTASYRLSFQVCSLGGGECCHYNELGRGLKQTQYYATLSCINTATWGLCSEMPVQ